MNLFRSARGVVALVLFLMLFVSHETRSVAWGLGDAIGAVGGVTGGVVGGAGAILGGVIPAATGILGGGAASTVAGPAIKGSFDPTIDRFSERMTEVSNHAAAKLNETFTSALADTDARAKARIEQFDQVLKSRLDQVDDIAARTVARASDAARAIVDEHGAILDRAAENLREIEDEYFERNAELVLDQFPLAAERIFQRLLWMSVLLGLLAFVAVCLGVSFFRSNGKALERIKKSWSSTRPLIATVTAITVLVSVGYAVVTLGLLQSAVGEIERQAESLEENGAFQNALAMRRRARILSTSDQRRYREARDEWLAAYLDSRRPIDVAGLTKMMSGIVNQFKVQAQADSLLTVARVHFAVMHLQTWPELRQQMAAELRKLEQSPASTQPAIAFATGPRVYLRRMSEAMIALQDDSQPPSLRLLNADAILDLFDNEKSGYAAGLILSSQVKALRHNLVTMGLNLDVKEEAQSKAAAETIQKLVASASENDLKLVQLVMLNAQVLPASLKAAISATGTADAASWPAAQRATLSAELDRFADSLMPLALSVYGQPSLARPVVEQAVARLSAKALWEEKVTSALGVARQSFNGQSADLPQKALDMCTNARNAGHSAVAYEWAFQGLARVKADDAAAAQQKVDLTRCRDQASATDLRVSALSVFPSM